MNLTLKTLLPFALSFVLGNSFAQQYVNLIDETLTVNSATAITGNSRNISRVALPAKTIGYVYRISIFNKGNNAVNNSLFDLIKSKAASSVVIGASIAEFAIANADGNSIDAFIFNNTYDADNFLAKKDDNWSSCKSLANRSNCCLSSKECIAPNMIFGFRNNNIRQGLDVKFELIAIVDTASANAFNYSYTISNGTNQEVKFQLSADNRIWQQQSLRNGYQNTFSVPQARLYFKIYTNVYTFATYSMEPGERYKIIWNAIKRKWDLIRY